MIPAELAVELERGAAFRRALRRFLRRTEEVTRAHSLTPHRYHLLLAVAARGESTITQLCDDLQLAQPSVTQLVQRAEAAGLVRRRPSPSDARLTCVDVTDEGTKRLLEAFAELRLSRREATAEFEAIDSTLADAGPTLPPG